MVTLYDATRPVKTSRRFGAGLLRSLPTYRQTVSAADEAWLCEDNARREREAAEAAAYDRFVDAVYERSEPTSWTDADQMVHHGCV